MKSLWWNLHLGKVPLPMVLLSFGDGRGCELRGLAPQCMTWNLPQRFTGEVCSAALQDKLARVAVISVWKSLKIPRPSFPVAFLSLHSAFGGLERQCGSSRASSQLVGWLFLHFLRVFLHFSAFFFALFCIFLQLPKPCRSDPVCQTLSEACKVWWSGRRCAWNSLIPSDQVHQTCLTRMNNSCALS